MKKVALSFVAVAALTASVAQAAPKTEGAYVFGNYTHANLKSDTVGGQYEDHSKNTFGLGGGYRFTEHFALEAGYKGLGKNGDSSYREGKTYKGINNEQNKASAFVVRAIGILPVTSELNLEGFIGAALVSHKYNGSSTEYNKATGTTTSNDESEQSKTSLVIPSIGVGATYAINDELTAFTRYEYIAMPDMTFPSGGEIKSKSHSVDIGLRYHF